MTEIRTKRLLLRRARADDLAGLHDVFSDSEAMRYWSRPPHDSIDETRVWVHDMMSAPETESDDFVVELDGRVIGKAGCWRLPEIGYILHPSVWGRGYGAEALAAVTTHIFTRHSIPEIIAEVDPRNVASLALLAKLGFEETGRAERNVQIGDEWCDTVYLALKRPDDH